MRSQLLQSLSSICWRNASTATSCISASTPAEVLASRFSTLTSCFSLGSVSSPLLTLGSAPYLTSCRRENVELVHQQAQLLNLKGFTSKAASWQDAPAPAAGINPLMQTPAPATSMLTPDPAAVQPNRTAQAVLRKTKISPKKLNEAARLIRRMHIDDALVQCQIAPQKAAKLCYKLLLSAKDNAEKDKGLDPDKLRVDRAFVGKGQYAKRMKTHARGRSGVRHVYRAHLTIILAEGGLKRVTQFRPPNAQWHKNRRTNFLRAASSRTVPDSSP